MFLIDTRWPEKDLTYRITKYSRKLDKRQTDLVIRRAFDVWSSVTPLTFTYKGDGKVSLKYYITVYRG